MENSILNAPRIKHKSTPHQLNFLDNNFSLDNIIDCNTNSIVENTQDSSVSYIQIAYKNQKLDKKQSFKWRKKEYKQVFSDIDYMNFPILLFSELNTLIDNNFYYYKEIESHHNFFSR